MKRIAFALGLVAATMTAVPLAAQQRNDGPWWDPANTGGRSGSTTRVDTRDGRIYNDGRIYDSRRADGQWRREGRDRSGNIIYVRTRYDGNGNLIRERARRDTFGRYRVIDRRVIQYANRRNDRDRDRNNDGWYDRDGRRRNDRWAQNNGHDNGKHNGWYKDKHNKGKGKNKR
jgi:hypothetical protein